jgi:hypothetical protein
MKHARKCAKKFLIFSPLFCPGQRGNNDFHIAARVDKAMNGRFLRGN